MWKDGEPDNIRDMWGGVWNRGKREEERKKMVQIGK